MLPSALDPFERFEDGGQGQDRCKAIDIAYVNFEGEVETSIRSDAPIVHIRPVVMQ